MKLSIKALWVCVATVALSPACTQQDEPVRTNVEQQTAHASARQGDEVQAQTAEEVLTSLLVYVVKKEGETLQIRSGQSAYPSLTYLGFQATDEGKVHTFTTGEKWYQVRLQIDDSKESAIRTAASQAGLLEPGQYQEEIFYEGETSSYDIDEKIPTTVFFEELIFGLELLKNTPFEIPQPIVAPGQGRAVCRGSNQGLVLSCLHATAAAQCGGHNSYSHGSVSFNGSRGSMSYQSLQ